MPHVLLVMRRQGNLRILGEALGGHGYTVTGATSQEDLEGVLRGPVPADAALVDVSGYRGEVWSLCETLQQAHVPFLVISEPRRSSFGSRGLEFGAASVLEKPLAKRSLLKLLEGLTRP